MAGIVERLTSIAIAVSALTIAVVVVRREFAPAPRRESQLPEPEFHSDWKQFRRAGIPISGDSTSPVQILEFGDLQCPVCAMFDPIVASVTQRYGTRVARVFVHFPLGGHDQALPAARAAECAERQGAFQPMKVVLYAKQRSFGVTPWTTLAREAGLPDLPRFERCMADIRPVDRIDSGVALARRLGFQGTPTTVVNGWAIRGSLSDSGLSQTIDAALVGKKPPRDIRR